MKTRITAHLLVILAIFFLIFRQLGQMRWQLALMVIVFPYIIINALDAYFLSASLGKKPGSSDASAAAFFIGVAVSVHPVPVVLLPMNAHFIAALRGLGGMSNFLIAGFIIWALSSLGNNLTVLPEANALVSRGPYRLVRHPLYFAYIIMAIDEAAMYQTLPVAALAVIQIALIIIRAKREEALLLDKMPGYAEYCKKVPWFSMANKT